MPTHNPKGHTISMGTRTTSSAAYLCPSYRGIFAVDITSFGSRELRLALQARRTLRDLIEDACGTAGMCWDQFLHEDRGDGLLAFAPCCQNIEVLVDQFAAHVRAGLSRSNKTLTASAQIRLRMAIDAGHVVMDEYGFTGRAVTRIFRLLEAPAVRAKLARSGSEFALLVSDHIYQEIISYSPGQVDPATFEPVSIDYKETSTRVWLSQTRSRHPCHASTAAPATRSRHLTISCPAHPEIRGPAEAAPGAC
jgi:hypothetical protein